MEIVKASWSGEETAFVRRLYSEGVSIEDICNRLNSLGSGPTRSPRAVAFKLFKLGMISQDKLVSFDEKRDAKIKSKRDSGWRGAKNAVLKRDGYKCVICGEKKGLQFAHTVPFRRTMENKEIEAVTLCPKDHELFDSKNAFETKKIFEWMVSKYSDYEKKYKICEKFDMASNKDLMWIERV